MLLCDIFPKVNFQTEAPSEAVKFLSRKTLKEKKHYKSIWSFIHVTLFVINPHNDLRQSP